MAGWIDLVIVSIMLLLTEESITDWSDRYMIWTKIGIKRYELQMCASKDEVLMCGNFTWSQQSCKAVSSVRDTKNMPCFSDHNCTKTSSLAKFNGNS
jgi:hypothetical protein